MYIKKIQNFRLQNFILYFILIILLNIEYIKKKMLLFKVKVLNVLLLLSSIIKLLLLKINFFHYFVTKL